MIKRLLFAAMLWAQADVYAQVLHLKTGAFTPEPNIGQINTLISWPEGHISDRVYCLMQFDKPMNQTEIREIQQVSGIRFYDYFPRYAYLVSVPEQLQVSQLTSFHVRSLIPWKPIYKIAPRLNNIPLPEWMVLDASHIRIQVTLLPESTPGFTVPYLESKGWKMTPGSKPNRIVLDIPGADLQAVAELPFVYWIEPPSAPPSLENLTERTNHRVNTIDASYVTGLHYDGTGVSIGIGDDGIVGPHIDFTGRLIHHTGSNGGTHGDHVAGIAGGGGNFDPITSGNGRGSDLHIYSNYGNLNNALSDYVSDGIRITSNSLGQGCNIGYDSDARDADELVNGAFSLMSVHSAGNSGNTSCGGVPGGFFTITGGYKAGKNVIAVGNVDNSDVLAGSSSQGPSEDGRIKPDIVAVGTDVYSTQPDNTYDTFTGTSMSCPGVSGTLASLWQAYRETHLGQDPPSALMKGLVLNTADDLGRKGPDFEYGFGRINARRAYRAMINNQYFVDSLNSGDLKDFFINIPPNTQQVKIMLYWNDVEGNPASGIALVNDLNLTVQEPSGNVIEPWVLDNTPTVASLTAPAVRGGDNLNNVEQVTLDSVFPGPCVISVFGNDVPQGPQRFVLTYEFLGPELTLTYPQGGESFVPGVKERIRWDAHGNTGNFSLEYSDDAGTTWNLISSTIPGSLRFLDWTPPSTLATGQMKMRISRGSVADESDTLFTVFEVPKNLEVDTACVNTFHLRWDAVPGADSYRVWSMGPKYMNVIATTSTNELVITGVNMTDTFYYAVSAINITSGANGLRTIAHTKLPGNINCVHDAFNVATILPFDEAYNCSITGTLPIKVKIKNVGFKDLVNHPVFYQINTNPVVSEIIPGPIAIGDSLIYTFTNLANFSAPIVYNVKTWTSLLTDIVLINDTSQATATVLVPTTLLAPSIQDFEGPLFPPTGWRVLDQDVNVKWQKTLVLGGPTGFNTYTAYMDFFNYGSMNQVDELESAQFDLGAVTSDSVLLTFDLSHAYGVKGIDSLQVLVSDDCGATYNATTFHKGGIPLATVGMMGTIYSPTLSTQWRNEQIDLTSYKGQKIFVKFRALNMQGNNLFIDNINIMLKDAWPLETSSAMQDEFMQVYPNPSDGKYTLEFSLRESGQVSTTVYNITGQRIQSQLYQLHAGKTRTALDLSHLAAGTYMLEVTQGSVRKQVKLMKH